MVCGRGGALIEPYSVKPDGLWISLLFLSYDVDVYGQRTINQWLSFDSQKVHKHIYIRVKSPSRESRINVCGCFGTMVSLTRTFRLPCLDIVTRRGFTFRFQSPWYDGCDALNHERNLGQKTRSHLPICVWDISQESVSQTLLSRLTWDWVRSWISKKFVFAQKQY